MGSQRKTERERKKERKIDENGSIILYGLHLNHAETVGEGREIEGE